MVGIHSCPRLDFTKPCGSIKYKFNVSTHSSAFLAPPPSQPTTSGYFFDLKKFQDTYNLWSIIYDYS